MTTDSLHSIALEWFKAFNQQDLEGLLALYADDASHYSPKLKARQPASNGWIKGKAALHDWWKDAFARLPSLRYQVIQLTAESNRVFMEYLRHVEGEEVLRVGEMLEIREGLIVESSVYHG